MEGNSRRSALRGMALVMLLLAAAALVMIYQANQSKGTNVTAAGSEGATTGDVKRLWEWTDGELQGGAPGGSWQLRFDADASVDEVKRMAELLGIKPLAVTAGALDETDGLEGNLWQGEVVRGGGALSLWAKRTGSSGRAADLVIRYELGQKASLDALLAQANAVLSAAAETGLHAKMNLNVHGYAIRSNSMRRLADIAQADSRDTYKDGATVSATYFTPLLTASVSLGGGKKGNLQLAVHDDTESKRIELTAGVPLISGDYSKAD
ncbi:YwmB family TATA-box binding protein [Paenibacillus beijingensis]|uniref:TATA-box binding protein n=1 Tax=Paenibacillus beijingensis TaxID=1126833 RepID=A0A0D5NFX2_9BACL|nr:YwmB family TATA-box binding protein [Paenibacillus beijingensis]AJY73813.1 hypothetical protein VN24_03160 [Paenibacillus beijingensis]